MNGNASMGMINPQDLEFKVSTLNFENVSGLLIDIC